MKVNITEYLCIDLESELWHCRVCEHAIGPARDNYKKGLLVHDRDPREIHRPLLNPELYEYTFSPDPRWCALLEFYCPGCGTMVETEYTVPGHPPVHDIELDIDSLKARWRGRVQQGAAAVAPVSASRRHMHRH